MSKLTDKQERFAQEYLIDLNATQAAIRAGYAETWADSQAYQLLQKTPVSNRISELQEKRAERLQITQDQVLRELAKIGFSNIQDYYNEGLQLQDINQLDKGHASAINSIKKSVTTFKDGKTETVEFKLHDKLNALEKIARHIDFYKEDSSSSGNTYIFTDDYGDEDPRTDPEEPGV